MMQLPPACLTKLCVSLTAVQGLAVGSILNIASPIDFVGASPQLVNWCFRCQEDVVRWGICSGVFANKIWAEPVGSFLRQPSKGVFLLRTEK